MPNQVIDVILELGASHLQLFNLLVRSEVDFFFYAINFIVQPMIFIEHFPEMIIRAFEAPDNFTMLRELSQDRMMEVHGSRFLFHLINGVE